MLDYKYISALKASEISNIVTCTEKDLATSFQKHFKDHFHSQLILDGILVIICFTLMAILIVFYNYMRELSILIGTFYIAGAVFCIRRLTKTMARSKQFDRLICFKGKVVNKKIEKDDFYFGTTLIQGFNRSICVEIGNSFAVKNISVDENTFHNLKDSDEVVIMYFPDVTNGNNLFAKKIL